MGNDLDRTYEQIVERLRVDDKVTPQELLRRHRELQETVIHVPERVVSQGQMSWAPWISFMRYIYTVISCTSLFL